MQENKQRSRIAKVFVRSPSKRLNGGSADSQSPQLANGNTTTTSGSSESNGKAGGVGSKSMRPHDNKVTSKQSGSKPRKAWQQQGDEDTGPYIIEQVARAHYDSPQLQAKQQQQFNGNGSSGGSNGNGQSLHFNSMEAGHLVLNEEGLVNVRLVADEQARFGFNVKGGADLQMPVLVSRVAPHTPADLSTPRISEGDQVVMINGRDISGLKHEQVVSLIRASREYRGGELVLTIKPQGEERTLVALKQFIICHLKGLSANLNYLSSTRRHVRGGAPLSVRARGGRRSPKQSAADEGWRLVHAVVAAAERWTGVGYVVDAI